jgi:hypothetical protein
MFAIGDSIFEWFCQGARYNAKKQIGGCLRIFFVHGNLKIASSPWCMEKQRQSTLGGQYCKCHLG